MNLDEAWTSVLSQLQVEMPRASFDTWVRDTEVVSLEDGRMTIATRNAYAREWLDSRLGSTVQRPSNFRLICATNKPLEQEVAAGRFRSDLYYRINVVPLRVPPLRERRDDILPLCLFFLDHFNRKFNKNAGPLQGDAIATLENAHWAGNVRELKHTIERAVVVNAGGPVPGADLGVAGAAGDAVNVAAAVQTQLLPYREARLLFEHAYFSNLMQAADGNVSEASRISGVARQNIYGHLERADIVTKS